MSSSDWVALTNSDDASVITRGVIATAAVPPAPPGQSDPYVYGMRALSPGVLALRTDLAGFTPIAAAKSAQITIALRAIAGAQVFAFAGLQGAGQIDRVGYQLGLDPYGFLTLSKGLLTDDINAPAKILRHSSAPYAPGSWVHCRLDVVINTNVSGTEGDVIVHAWTSSSGNVFAPAWERTLLGYVDDVLAAGTGSKPLRGGYVGYGAKFTAAGQAALFAAVTTAKGA